MATSTFSFETTFTPTGGLQPDQTSPPTLPTFSDTRPTQVVQTTMLLPAEGSAIALPVPASWTTVYQVVLQNVDASGYVQVVCKGGTPASPAGAVNPTYSVLAPNGGYISQGFVIGSQAGIQYSRVNLWTVQAVTSAGASTASTATNLYVYLAGA